jgi:cobalt-zinc-cadmium efflux system membrane fusion protein
MDPYDDEAFESDPPRPRRRRAWRVLLGVLAALALIGVGAAGTALVLRGGLETRRVETPPAPVAPPAPAAAPAVPAAPPAETEVTLSADALARAGLKTARVEAVEPTVVVRVPASVVANAYREVKVTPLVGGVVTRVDAQLGTPVQRGAPLATVFSSELADVQTKYLSLRAMLEADEKKLDRTRQLADIGAASRQELEEVTALHASRLTELEAARQRLLLLGLSRRQIAELHGADRVVSTVVVPAPIDGVVTARTANLGQVVGMGQELFVVTDLSEVWVVGDLYEQDFPKVRTGSEATLTIEAYPGWSLRGRVAYIDPRVDPQARTAKVRVEVPNRDGRLRLGMFLTMTFTTPSGRRVAVVPQAAVQTIGGRQVVYVPLKDEEGKFVQREIRIAGEMGDSYTITSGIQPGELVVTEGSFFLRAESLRNAPSG